MGTAVGGVIVLTNSQKLVKYFGVDAPWSTLVYVAIVVAWASLVVVAWRASKAPEFVPDELATDVGSGKSTSASEDAAPVAGTDSGTGTALR